MPRFLQMRALLKTQSVLLVLILGISLTFLLQILLGEKFYERFMTVPAEVVSAWKTLQAGDYQNVAWFEFVTLFTAELLHASPEHLINNMIFLWIFAAIAVELLGHRWMLFTFFFTAVTASICHTALNPEEWIPCLGASGAVMGFEGLYLAMAVRWRLPDPHVWPIARPVAPSRLAFIAVISLVFDFMNYTGGATGVAYGAHLGGFIGGIILGTFVVRMPRVALPR